MSYRAIAPHHTPRFLPTQARDVDGGPSRTLEIPGYRQARSYSCGYACALMVARYYQPEISGERLFAALGTGRDGTRQTALVRELRRAGLAANTRYDVGHELLRGCLDRNKLAIGYLADIEHWVVLYGYGLEPERVFVADPRPQTASVEPWMSYGPRLGGFAIVCSDPNALLSSLETSVSPPPETHNSTRANVQLSFSFASRVASSSQPE